MTESELLLLSAVESVSEADTDDVGLEDDDDLGSEMVSTRVLMVYTSTRLTK